MNVFYSLKRYAITAILLIIMSTTFASLAHANDNQPQDLTLAVASNFNKTLEAILKEFHSDSCKRISVSTGSTGKITTQIIHGAPYDIFLSADAAHPKLLVEKGYAAHNQIFTYAIGKLVLWAPKQHSEHAIQTYLSARSFRHIAIANPELAPYGLAAKQYLQHTHIWNDIKSKLVFGENINQAFHFVKSGNAQLGIISLSQALQITDYKTILKKDEFIVLPEETYKPIKQQAILLKKSEQNLCAQDFWTHLKLDSTQSLIQTAGYNKQNDFLISKS